MAFSPISSRMDSKRKTRNCAYIHRMEFSQERLTRAINEQGGLFQDACRYILERYSGATGWNVEDTEHPVASEDNETRMDIVLRQSPVRGRAGLEFVAAVECKRANPEYVGWVFAERESIVGGEPFGSALIGSHREPVGSGLRASFSTGSIRMSQGPQICDVGFALRPESKGSRRRGSAAEPIEAACRQVLFGTFGLANEICGQNANRSEAYRAMFVPIVITTAPLFVATYPLEDINIPTGTISEDEVWFGESSSVPEATPWLVVDYPVGHSIVREVIPPGNVTVDTKELGKLRRRSVFIVNAAHLKHFFGLLHTIVGQVIPTQRAH